MTLIILQRLFLEALIDIFYAPVWWYTRGALYVFKKGVHLIQVGNEECAPGLWLKNLFVPMFGSYDWQGRIISFFMRLVQVIARSFALLIWSWFVLLFCMVWLFLPFIAFYGIGKSLFF
jgi:hypothetical protein